MFMPTVKHTLPNRSISLNRFSARIDFMKTGERVKKARAFLELTQEAFGKVAGVSKAAVSQWENGVTTPQRDALLNLSRKRHISPEWITSGRGEMVEVERAAAAPASALTVEQAEILSLWAQLAQSEQTEMLGTIKKKAAHNREVAEQFAPKVVRVTDMRKRQVHFEHQERRDNKDKGGGHG